MRLRGRNSGQTELELKNRALQSQANTSAAAAELACKATDLSLNAVEHMELEYMELEDLVVYHYLLSKLTL